MGDKAADVTARGPVTVEELIALNDEIAALARAGMPLERGLLDVGSDLPGRLRGIATALGARMSRGESLLEALEASGGSIPPVYLAVVEAGLRAGRLPMALEGLSTYARSYAEARRSIGLALWYPMLILSLAYVLFVGVVTLLIPRFLGAFEAMGIPVHGAVRLLDILGRTAWYWVPLLPLVLAFLLAGWILTRRSNSLGRGGASGLLGWFPWMGSMMRGFEAASFADLLALLVEHRVPYPQALVLAGEASGDPSLARSSRALADSVGRGLPPEEGLENSSAFPPLLRWLLATAPKQGNLVVSLRQMASRYRSAARYQAEKLRVFLPTVLLFGIGATATLLYALALFVPLVSLWKSVASQAP
jgi:type II secretory pathway component PulF